MGHPIPAGQRSITPHLVVAGAAEAIEFYKKAFDANEISRMLFPSSDGSMKVGHAELEIGDSKLYLADEFPGQGGMAPGDSSPVTIHLYVTDADATFAQAVEAGVKVVMPLMDMFWGDRFAKVIDPFGHHWTIAEHLEDLTSEQMKERMLAFAGRRRGLRRSLIGATEGRIDPRSAPVRLGRPFLLRGETW